MAERFEEAIELQKATGASWEYIMGTTRPTRKALTKAAISVADRHQDAVKKASKRG